MKADLSASYSQELIKHIQKRYEGNPRITTEVDALSFYHGTEPTEFLTTVYSPSLCLVVQGAKEVGLDEEMYRYDTRTYLLSSVHIPARVRIAEASEERPYMGLVINFSMEQIFEILKEMKMPSKSPNRTKRGLYFGEVDRNLIEPVLRLVRLLEVPEDIPVMSPLILKELIYVVMRGEGGDFIRQYIHDGSAIHQVVQVITKIKDDFKESLNMKELAKSVGMSESSLYHNFKKVTAMSPLQFQKTLRLHEARQILLSCEIDAAQVAFDVGYESPSQFSREYSRLFGLPPKTDVRQSGRESA